MSARIHPSLRLYFTNSHGRLVGAFGHQANTRVELIRIAMEGERVERGPDGTILNVVYIGDAPKDLQAGMNAGVRTIFFNSDRELFNRITTKGSPRTVQGDTFYNPALTRFLGVPILPVGFEKMTEKQIRLKALSDYHDEKLRERLISRDDYKGGRTWRK